MTLEFTVLDDVTRYPLDWPLGWKRTPSHQRRPALFRRHVQASAGNGSPYRRLERLSVGDGLDRLLGELRRLGASRVIVSSNLRVRSDGLPYAQQAKRLDDPGVAVYFQLKRQSLALACDKWTSAAENMAAIAGHIEAIRAQDRYGVGSLEQAFAGYKALPADTAADWRKVFGFPADSRPTLDQVDSAFKAAARQRHPDLGGTDIEMAHVNRARDYARQELLQ